MKRESKFWRWIRDNGLPGKWTRIEVKLPLGFPDCVVNYSGRTFLTELKDVLEWGKPANLGLRPEQAGFHLGYGGECYVLARVAGVLYWFDKRHIVRIRRKLITPYESLPGPFALNDLSQVARERCAVQPNV